MDKITNANSSGTVSGSACVSASSEEEVSQGDVAKINVKASTSGGTIAKQAEPRVCYTELDVRRIVDEVLQSKMEEMKEEVKEEVGRDIEGIKREQGVMNQRQCSFDARLNDCDRMAKAAMAYAT